MPQHQTRRKERCKARGDEAVEQRHGRWGRTEGRSRQAAMPPSLPGNRQQGRGQERQKGKWGKRVKGKKNTIGSSRQAGLQAKVGEEMPS